MIYCNTCRLVTLADTNNDRLTTRYQQSIIGIGCLKSADTKNRHDVWYRPLKWADMNIVIFGSGPLK
jgi:hypothetical protein